MSYKKKKIKKSKFNQLKYKLGLVKIALLKIYKKVGRKEGKMRLPQTRSVMEWLRRRSKLIRQNSLKINEWVDDYVNNCLMNGKPVEILTQWCISKDLEVRYLENGKSFTPTKKERLLFEKEIPAIVEELVKNGISFNWWVTFNRSYLDSGRIARDVESAYQEMIEKLAENLIRKGWIIFIDWETDVLGKKPEPNAEVLNTVEKMVEPRMLELEIQRHSSWAREEAGLDQSDEKLREEVYFQIACEAEEGKFLSGGGAPFGEFILIPLETPERYDFFTLYAPDFKKRIVLIPPFYPWRLKENS